MKISNKRIIWYLIIVALAIYAVSSIKYVPCLFNKSDIKQNVEVKNTNIINIETKFDLSNVEYVKRVFKNVDITSYNNQIEQTDDTPNITASNRAVREGIVAVSQDFISKGFAKFGDLIYIDCFDKWYTIEDSMNKRFEKRVDVFLFNKQESLKINKKCGIEIIHYTK